MKVQNQTSRYIMWRVANGDHSESRARRGDDEVVDLRLCGREAPVLFDLFLEFVEMSSSSTSMSLRALFSRALQSASRAQTLATMDDETQVDAAFLLTCYALQLLCFNLSGAGIIFFT